MKKQAYRLMRESYAFELFIPIVIVAISESVVVVVVWCQMAFLPFSLTDYVQFQQPMLAQFAIFNFLWGGWRVYTTDPIFSKGYFEWIKQTPWTPKANLPAGSVRLNFRDAVLLGLVSGWFFWRGGFDAGCISLIGFGVGYSLMLWASFAAVGLDRVCYGAVVATNMILWTTMLEPWCLLVAVLILVAGMRHFINIGLMRMMELAEYPFASRLSSGQDSFKSLGWPHYDLSPKSLETDSTKFSFNSPTIVILLAASLANTSCVISFHEFKTNQLPFLSWEATVVLHVGVAVGIGVVRLVHWSLRILPPGGRLAIRRLFFWRYDVVFVAPFIGIAISAGLAVASGWNEGLWVITIPLSTGLAVLCNGLIGPSYLHFRATHAGRLGCLLPPSNHELTN